MLLGCCIAVFSALSASASENLLRNAAFSLADADEAPKHWDHFVGAMPGAWARTGSGIDDESVALGLFAPEAYELDTVNSWSQVLEKPYRGKTLKVSGWIRTFQAAEAAIWLQCFDGQPLRLVGGATSKDIHPLRGTNGWTPVSFTCEIPSNTKATVLRCVLRAPGEAWFTDLHVVEWDETAARPESEIETLIPEELPAELSTVEVLAEQLRSTIRELEESNRELQDRIMQMRRNITEERRALADIEAAAQREPVSLEPVEVRHPLVPVPRKRASKGQPN